MFGIDLVQEKTVFCIAKRFDIINIKGSSFTLKVTFRWVRTLVCIISIGSVERAPQEAEQARHQRGRPELPELCQDAHAAESGV